MRATGPLMLMLVERLGSALPNWIMPVAVMFIVSVPAKALATSMAARRVHAPVLSAHVPLPCEASGLHM